ncbi:DUF222 domain-containing protein [Microbacterium oryzae]|uniref:HNH endonuclease n=1 Tax=Microbacterium oryzae TaxID=743009 RepID=UPI0025B0B19D|nr:HNH endonuclease signature motif containing protein [Microbacterium oryzae]MDN3309805.1 DUF222 domain-containing protein [Microbacterium oryzae]
MATRRAVAVLEARQVELVAQLGEIAFRQYEREVAAAGGVHGETWVFRSMAEELAAAVGCTRGKAERDLADAEALMGSFPTVFAAVEAGEVTLPQAHLIIEHGTGLNDAARPVYERVVLDKLAAQPLSQPQLGQMAESVAQELHPVPLPVRFASEHAKRSVVVRRGRDGMAHVDIYMSLLQAAGVLDRVQQLAQAVKDAAGPDGDDIRTAAQRQADVAADLLLAGAPTAGPHGVPTGTAGIRGTVQVTIPARTLTAETQNPDGAREGECDDDPGEGEEAPTPSAEELDLDGFEDDPGEEWSGEEWSGDDVDRETSAPPDSAEADPEPPPGSPPEPEPPSDEELRRRAKTRAAHSGAATLCGHGVIPAIQACELAAVATAWVRLFQDAHTGALLTADLRFPTAAQRRFLRARDEHCRFPGCRRPIRKRVSDADHTVDHALGGPTCVCNLAYLCEGHHTLKHRSAWTVEQEPGGILEWTSPAGRCYENVPAPMVRFLPDEDDTRNAEGRKEVSQEPIGPFPF